MASTDPDIQSSSSHPRRQSSSTSLSRYIRTEPSLEQRSLDFCNAFWGPVDGGVDVLLTRMRGAMRTVEEVRAFYKERVAIEEEYAKKLNKLAKMNVGKDEIGELRNSIDTLRLETDKQATSHLQLAQSIRQECEAPITEFANRASSHRKNYTASVERFFKNKQTQEGYVSKAREKYEQDCMRINFCTAKLSIEQGKELEKTQIKLERAKQSVVQSEREYQNFVRALKDTWSRWEKEWKGYCDRCQDLEEERIDFLKDNFWTFANAVSTVCVSDDESCEKLRVALEQLEPEKDMENFVRDYGTGPLIPEAPPFIDYSAPDPRPPSTRPRHANFARSSMRPVGVMIPPERSPIDDDDVMINGPGVVNAAGVGAGGGIMRRDSVPNSPVPPSTVSVTAVATSTPPILPERAPARTMTQSKGKSVASPSNTNVPTIGSSSAGPIRAPSRPQSTYQSTTSESMSQSSSQPLSQRASAPPLASEFKPPRDPHAPPVDPTSQTMIKIGDRAYPADPNKDPQATGAIGRRPTSRAAPPTSAINDTVGSSQSSSGIGGQEDPLLKQMNDLQKEGSLRRNSALVNSTVRPTSRQATTPAQAQGSSSSPAVNVNVRNSIQIPQTAPPTSNLGPPSNSRISVDYHAAADALVGAHPASRPSSPANPVGSPPVAKHMQPPPASSSSPHLPVEEVVNNYQQRLPGERPLSAAGMSSRGPVGNGGPNRDSHIEVPQGAIQRPASREGHVGIGAHGRASPQPMQIQGRPLSRGPSPVPQGVPMNGPNGGPAPGYPSSLVPSSTIAIQGGVGIRLDSQGRVIQDSRAEAYGGGRPVSGPGYGPPPGSQAQQPPQGDPRVSMYGRPISQIGGPGPIQQQQPARVQQPGPGGYSAGPGAVHRAPSVHRSPSPQPGYGAPPPQGLARQWQPNLPPQQVPPPPPPQQQQFSPQQPSRINTDVGGIPPGPTVHRQSTLYNPHPVSPQRYGGPIQQQQVPQSHQSIQRQSSYGYVQTQVPPQQQIPPPAQQQQYGHNGYGGVGGPPYGNASANGLQRNSSYGVYGGPPPAAQHDYRASNIPQQMQRSPSPQPPPPQPPQPPQSSYQEEPKILFYVKALYDYRATIDEEFDFQTNDIIAVTSTPDDGWWTGILLDESRRAPGRNVFPSNFVTFF